MTNLRWLAVLLLVLAATLPSRTSLAQGAYSYVANTAPPDAFLALKAYPALKSPRIMAMANGTKLEVLLRRADGWWYVRVAPTGEEGWAFNGRGAKAYILCCADSAGTAAAPAQEPPARDISDFSCQQLWFGRNSIYKEAGYCFKTARAIAAFGNAGCRYDDADAVPLSPENRNLVQAFQRVERAKACTN